MLVDLPKLIELTNCSTNATELATIESLDREAAKLKIDGNWRRPINDVISDPFDEPDSEWRWRDLVSRAQNKPFFRARCVKSANGDIQAALLLRVDTNSALVDEEGAIFIDRLATAPWNRSNLTKTPVFRGAGTGLITYAIALSYSLALGGRVNLTAVANAAFYLRLGFQFVRNDQYGDALLEISAEQAHLHLVERGLIDG